MANSHITTGKYIYELVDLGTTLKEDAVFPVAQDNLTRKVEARVFRKFINGDKDEPSDELYYSSQKIDELLGKQSDIIDNINEEINNINNRIDNLTDTVNENYEALNKRITEEVNKINDRIDQEVENINNRIDEVYEELVAADDDLRERCTQLEERCTNLEERCTKIEQSIKDLDDKLEGWILYGSAPPTTSTLPAGRLYIQWF